MTLQNPETNTLEIEAVSLALGSVQVHDNVDVTNSSEALAYTIQKAFDDLSEIDLNLIKVQTGNKVNKEISEEDVVSTDEIPNTQKQTKEILSSVLKSLSESPFSKTDIANFKNFMRFYANVDSDIKSFFLRQVGEKTKKLPHDMKTEVEEMKDTLENSFAKLAMPEEMLVSEKKRHLHHLGGNSLQLLKSIYNIYGEYLHQESDDPTEPTSQEILGMIKIVHSRTSAVLKQLQEHEILPDISLQKEINGKLNETLKSEQSGKKHQKTSLHETLKTTYTSAIKDFEMACDLGLLTREEVWKIYETYFF